MSSRNKGDCLYRQWSLEEKERDEAPLTSRLTEKKLEMYGSNMLSERINSFLIYKSNSAPDSSLNFTSTVSFGSIKRGSAFEFSSFLICILLSGESLEEDQYPPKRVCLNETFLYHYN